MMEAALNGANSISEKQKIRRPKIIAVTILTSIDANILNNEINVPCPVEEQVLRLAKLTHKAGLDGIVCSAADLYAIKDKLPQNFIFVTPGIKGIHEAATAGVDQKRIFTPGNAIKNGATILVAGRTITAYKTSKERIRAGSEILKDMAKFISKKWTNV
jgi:orotidine-5'-phosphate decarboxylase